MVDTLRFDLSLDRPGFRLQGCADIPLQGITGIAGASGSGKTTLLRALAGLEDSVKGRVAFGDQDWSDRPAQQRPIGFVFQDMRLFRHISVAKNLGYGAKRRNAPEQAVLDVIKAFDLQELLDRRPASLSGGEARRVALARALATRPEILFLDEPMVGLDTDRRAEVLPYITRAVDEFGLAVLYVSHSQFEMNLLADRILPIADGQIGGMQDGPPRFQLPVFRAETGVLHFGVKPEEFCYPGTGAVGDLWEIRPGNGSILTQNHPGTNSAAAVFPVTVVSPCKLDNTIAVSVAGQTICVAAEAGFEPGQQMWLICPRLRARYRQPGADPG